MSSLEGGGNVWHHPSGSFDAFPELVRCIDAFASPGDELILHDHESNRPNRFTIVELTHGVGVDEEPQPLLDVLSHDFKRVYTFAGSFDGGLSRKSCEALAARWGQTGEQLNPEIWRSGEARVGHHLAFWQAHQELPPQGMLGVGPQVLLVYNFRSFELNGVTIIGSGT